MDATSATSKIHEQRETLLLLLTLLALQEALADRILLLTENRDHPAVDVEAWDHLIAEAKVQRAKMSARIAALRTKLGINRAPQLH